MEVISQVSAMQAKIVSYVKAPMGAYPGHYGVIL